MLASPLPDSNLSGDDDRELVAVVSLVRSQLLSAAELSAAVEHFGSARTVLDQALAGQLRSSGNQQILQPMDPAVVERAGAELSAWRSQGLDVRSLLDPDYPQALLSVHNRPALLFFEGRWDAQRDERAIAVVGTRRASAEGIARARRLSADLSAAGFTVISGMARGIDTAAHLATLDAGGRTVAVMGTGIKRRYPRENARLADAIVESGGCLLSQFFPDQPPTKWSFPARNIVMSGLCRATAVIEAGETSGAKLQAEAALYHGRSVFLLSSLVRGHAWAQRMVEQGLHGVQAVEVGSTDDIVKLLEVDSSLAPAFTV